MATTRTARPAALPYNSSTTLRRADRPGDPSGPVSLCACGGSVQSGTPTYMVVDTRAASSPVVGRWPYTAAGLRAATQAWEAECARVGAVEVSR